MNSIPSLIALIIQGSWLFAYSQFNDFGVWILLSIVVIPIISILSAILIRIDYKRGVKNSILKFAIILSVLHFSAWMIYMIYVIFFHRGPFM